MTTIFVSHAQEQRDDAEQMRQQLETRGYVLWRDPDYPDTRSASYPQMIERAILGSAALVLVWNLDASHDAWVERHILFAQSLKKLIFAVLLDSTVLPNTLIAVSSLTAQTTCLETVADLIALPNFPIAQSIDPFLLLCEQAAHEFIRVRKDAIDAAATMLTQGDHREEVLALLEYLAKHDAMMGIRERAQEVLDAQIPTLAAPAPFQPSNDARYIFGVRCKNGHVSYFDKRHVCTAHTTIPRQRTSRAGKELDELYLTCSHPGCGLQVVARVDCGDYR